MAFQGMDPVAGRETAEAIKNAGQQTQDLFDQLTQLVQAIEWMGPDAEAFKQAWMAFVNGPVAQIIDMYTEKSQNLADQAEEQDDTSNQN